MLFRIVVTLVWWAIRYDVHYWVDREGDVVDISVRRPLRDGTHKHLRCTGTASEVLAALRGCANDIASEQHYDFGMWPRDGKCLVCAEEEPRGWGA